MELVQLSSLWFPATMRSAKLWSSMDNTGETSFGSIFISFRNTSADMNSKLHAVKARTLAGRRVRRWSPYRLGRWGVASVGFLRLRVLGKIELE